MAGDSARKARRLLKLDPSCFVVYMSVVGEVCGRTKSWEEVDARSMTFSKTQMGAPLPYKSLMARNSKRARARLAKFRCSLDLEGLIPTDDVPVTNHCIVFTREALRGRNSRQLYCRTVVVSVKLRSRKGIPIVVASVSFVATTSSTTNRMAAAVVVGSTAILLHATRVLFECVAAPTTAQSYIFHGGTYAFDAVFI
eukprot:scaffold3240_cov187-Amphora_coffeaeformis.AAC.31